MTVYAAGALCWRVQEGVLLVAVIHRGRYNDWGWPKGKVDPGETLVETCVREIAEETGLKIKLGVSLGAQKYALPSGEGKEVHYWAAKVTDKALRKSKFKPSEEVSAVHWVPAAEVSSKLSYEHDKELVTQLIELHAKGSLETKPFVVLRHAKATPRSDWKKGESTRPLLPAGMVQARQLIGVLGAFGIKRVVSSPWKRCVTTVQPFARKFEKPIIKRSQLSELGNKKGPQRTEKVVGDLLEDGIATVVCAHRPSLPNILHSLDDYAAPSDRGAIEAGRALKPGHMLVAHLAKDAKHPLGRRVVSVETYAPFSE